MAARAFNAAGSRFRSELFIVTAIIAWTYLLHALLQKKGVDIRYHDEASNAVLLTKHGQEKLWDLSYCLLQADIPLDAPTIANLRLLIEFRNEIEHRNSGEVDEALSPYMQACCLNFNRVLVQTFGKHHNLERTLRLALQFASFTEDQFKTLNSQVELPEYLLKVTTEYAADLGEELFENPHFRMKVYYQAKSVNHPGNADEIVQFVKGDIDDSSKVSKVLIKEVEKGKHKPKSIVKQMKAEGFKRFEMKHHTELWQQLGAKEPKYQFGTTMSDGQWYWYDSWVERVRSHCLENRARYMPKAPAAVAQ